jgi:hypothetical protein
MAPGPGRASRVAASALAFPPRLAVRSRCRSSSRRSTRRRPRAVGASRNGEADRGSGFWRDVRRIKSVSRAVCPGGLIREAPPPTGAFAPQTRRVIAAPSASGDGDAEPGAWACMTSGKPTEPPPSGTRRAATATPSPGSRPPHDERQARRVAAERSATSGSVPAKAAPSCETLVPDRAPFTPRRTLRRPVSARSSSLAEEPLGARSARAEAGARDGMSASGDGDAKPGGQARRPSPAAKPGGQARQRSPAAEPGSLCPGTGRSSWTPPPGG